MLSQLLRNNPVLNVLLNKPLSLNVDLLTKHSHPNSLEHTTLICLIMCFKRPVDSSRNDPQSAHVTSSVRT